MSFVLCLWSQHWNKVHSSFQAWFRATVTFPTWELTTYELACTLGTVFLSNVNSSEITFPKLKNKGPTNNPKMLTIPSKAPSNRSTNAVTAEGTCTPLVGTNGGGDAGDDTGKKLKKNGETQKGEEMDKKTDGIEVDTLPEPKFEIVYRSGLDIGKFWMDNNIDCVTPSETPKEILLRVSLPEVTNASEVELNVSDTQALLTVPGLYKLGVKWRFVVDSAKGSAKFDKVNHKLEVCLPTCCALARPT